jgi:exosome complex exonuclease RRP6
VLQGKSKVDKIASSVVLPFHHFSGDANPPSAVRPTKEPVPSEPEVIQHRDPALQLEEVIQLDTGTDDPQVKENQSEDGKCEPEDTEMSEPASEVSSATEEQFHSLNDERNLKQNHKRHQEPEFNDQLKAFDYAEARNNVSFGEPKAGRRKDNTVARAINTYSGDKKKASNDPGGVETGENFQNPRRRQAFPPSGNRSSTYH